MSWASSQDRQAATTSSIRPGTRFGGVGSGERP
jgi:hypothetical protein